VRSVFGNECFSKKKNIFKYNLILDVLLRHQALSVSIIYEVHTQQAFGMHLIRKTSSFNGVSTRRYVKWRFLSVKYASWNLSVITLNSMKTTHVGTLSTPIVGRRGWASAAGAEMVVVVVVVVRCFNFYGLRLPS
jgi:hypothetical protein